MKSKIIKNILIIEDQPESNPRIIGKLAFKYNVTIANSVNSVQNYFREGRKFDLIFLDTMLPPFPYTLEETKDGRETGWVLYLKEFKGKNLKIIIWTRFQSILLSKDWGPDVIHKAIKNTDDLQLVKLANMYIKS